MNVRIVWRLLVAAMCAWVAAGAIHAQVRAAAPGVSDPCGLMTKEDAAAALGETAGAPQAKVLERSIVPGSTAMNCEYAGSGIHNVRLNVWHATNNVGQFRQIYQMASTGKSTEGLAGIGESAWWYNDRHEELQVLKGANFFTIELRRSGDATEAIKAVAKKVSSRLP